MTASGRLAQHNLYRSTAICDHIERHKFDSRTVRYSLYPLKGDVKMTSLKCNEIFQTEIFRETFQKGARNNSENSRNFWNISKWNILPCTSNRIWSTVWYHSEITKRNFVIIVVGCQRKSLHSWHDLITAKAKIQTLCSTWKKESYTVVKTKRKTRSVLLRCDRTVIIQKPRTITMCVSDIISL